jgi:starch phosphorylase
VIDGPDMLARAQVAYFSMEIAFRPDVPTYSGGLGVLAGDLMRSAADLGVPLVGVTLASRNGYFLQRIEHGQQLEQVQPWHPEQFAKPLAECVRVRIDSREVEVGAWLATVGSHCDTGQGVPVLLLDTDRPANAAADRRLTDALYGGDARYRLMQEIVLGVGGVRMLQALGVQPRKFHLNEGHSALLTLELLRRHGTQDADESRHAVRRSCVFTTHTPVAAGHDQFDYAWAEPLLGGLAPLATLRELAGAERLNMTQLALNLSGWVNGVAVRHAQTSRAMFPGYQVHAITNGVHPWTWAGDALRRLYDEHVPGWCHEPERLARAWRIPDDALWSAHEDARAALLQQVRQAAPQAGFEAGRLTLGIARRMTGYKRPGLLFTELERLRAIAREAPLQIVLAGKAHPQDAAGKAAIAQLHEWAAQLAPEVPVVFLPGYDMALARTLVAGCDLWLNTPQPPLEASGTSGMKAALNGVPSLSVLDGWWIEGWEEGVTGWAVGNGDPGDALADAHSLYDKLQQRILPLFHHDRPGWIGVMKAAITRNGAYFHSHRMVRRYALEAYGG